MAEICLEPFEKLLQIPSNTNKIQLIYLFNAYSCIYFVSVLKRWGWGGGATVHVWRLEGDLRLSLLHHVGPGDQTRAKL